MNANDMPHRLAQIVRDNSETVLPLIVTYTQSAHPEAPYAALSEDEQYAWGRNALGLFADAMVDSDVLAVATGDSSSMDIVVDDAKKILGPVTTALDWLYVIKCFAPFVWKAFLAQPSQLDAAKEHYFHVSESIVVAAAMGTTDRFKRVIQLLKQGTNVSFSTVEGPAPQENAHGRASQRGPRPLAGAAGAGDPLSSREHEVLRLLAVGKTNGEIAAALNITQNTVRNHVGHMLTKLGCRNRHHLALYAISRHYIDEQDILQSVDQ